MKRLYKRKPRENELNLTSLMDMFTIILFFFLSAYSFEGVLMKIAEGITLPRSASALPVAERYYIGISHDKITIGDTEYRNTGGDDAHILHALKKIKQKGINYLVIQADKGLPFYMVRNYIRLAVQAGFSKPFLAVLPK